MDGIHSHKTIFAWFITIQEKQTLARAVRIQKENWGVTMHFSEIIELKFGKKMPYIVLHFTVF